MRLLRNHSGSRVSCERLTRGLPAPAAQGGDSEGRTARSAVPSFRSCAAAPDRVHEGRLRCKRSRSSTRRSGTSSSATSSTARRSRTSTCSAADRCGQTGTSRGRSPSWSSAISRWASTACTSGGTPALNVLVWSRRARQGSGCTRPAIPPGSAFSITRGQPEGGPKAARPLLDLDDRRHLHRLGHRPARGDPSRNARGKAKGESFLPAFAESR